MLPDTYARWIARLLDAPVPVEGRATCETCAMAPAHGAVTGPQHFHADTKCCTYVPTLPNFRVGAILDDPTPEGKHGRESVAARVAAGAGVTPLGVAAPPVVKLVYDHGVTPSDSAFGRTRALRCPHFLEDTGGCGIWRYREATCATWFCKHERGATGQTFWETMRQLLAAVEHALARWCLLELDPGDEALRRLLDPPHAHPDGAEIDGFADPVRYATVWGRWRGREEEFYRACAERVEGLSPEEVARLGGAEVALLAHTLRRARARMEAPVPDRPLKLSPFQRVELGPVTSRVTTYREFDPVEIPTEVLTVLPRLEGRTPRRALQIAASAGVRLDADLLRRLLDYEVLVPG